MDRAEADGDKVGACLIDLAVEAPFTLARLAVSPPTRTVSCDGWSLRLEPRAMQVLTLLARAAPNVVGHATLNRRVWGGRVVGEDAINRAIQALRRVAAEAPAAPSFEIETVPRVGYRLIGATESAQPTAQSAPDRSEATAKRRLSRAAGWLAMTLVITLGAIWWWFDRARERPARWSVAATEAVTYLPQAARDVAFSPDGRGLAYRRTDAAGIERIHVRRGREGNETVVSPAGLNARHPAWSPDGRKLAFIGYDAAQPCRPYVGEAGITPRQIGTCETAREPRVVWSGDGAALMFSDAPGENAVARIVALRLADGERTVLSTPPANAMGDSSPVAAGARFLFQRRYAWGDEGWIERDPLSGAERVRWRRRAVGGTAAAALPSGGLMIAWAQAGRSGIDIVDGAGRVTTQAVALGQVTSLRWAGDRLLAESDRTESTLMRPGRPVAIASVDGRVSGATAIGDGRILVPVSTGGVSRIWALDRGGSPQPWGQFGATHIAGLSAAPGGQRVAAIVTAGAGREIVVFGGDGRPVFRWHPRARSVNAAAWSPDGRSLIVPVLDAAGWRLFRVPVQGGGSPQDLGQQGFALVMAQGSALYAVRAGETTGLRELWRLDGGARRLPVDLTLFDIVNWRVTQEGVWIPDRRNRDRPRLALHDIASGAVLRSLDAPGLAGSGTGIAADPFGPIYVRVARDAPAYTMLSLVRLHER